jgi:hypothetical protein
VTAHAVVPSARRIDGEQVVRTIGGRVRPQMPKPLAATLTLGAIAAPVALITATTVEGNDRILLTVLGVGGLSFLGIFFYAVAKSRR